MSNAQVIHSLGPPEVMRREDWELPDPGPGGVQIWNGRCGICSLNELTTQ